MHYGQLRKASTGLRREALAAETVSGKSNVTVVLQFKKTYCKKNGVDGLVALPMVGRAVFPGLIKKQLNKIQENFGPSQDELMKKNDRKVLPKKISKSGSSPFNSPFA